MTSRKYIIVLLFIILGSELRTQQSNELIFLSDTQAPIWAETILQPPYRNTEATDSLFNDLIKRKPMAFFLLGDLIAVGSDVNLWKDIDDNLAKLKEAGITTHSVPGNHEYMFSALHGIESYKKRFPSSNDFGYVTIQDSVAVIMLNSNFSKLSKTENKIQLDLLEKSLAIFDTASSIKNIIVACHHSPFTNSKIVKPDKEVQELFVKPFLNSTKANIFISGHSHNLEMFKHKDKMFLVIGGGGGLKQPTKPIGSRQWKDEINDSEKPLYFYIIVRRDSDKLTITARGIKKDFKFFELLLN